MPQQTVNRIFRSEGTPAPTYLPAGVLAYSANSDKLFIGTGSESGSWPNLDAANHDVIGGKLYIDMLDHTAGVLTASSALIVDSNKKLDELLIDNISINGNTISSTNTDGIIYLAPNGNGTVDFSSKRGTSVATPTGATDIANKQYVDSVAIGIRDFKDSVRAASTADLDLDGTETIDGISCIADDRVLVKDQSVASENGIYVVAAGAWSRSTDADEDSEVTSGLYVLVEEGTTQAGDAYVLSTVNPIVVDTTNLTFTKFSAVGSLSGTADRITIVTDVIDIASNYVGQASITTLGTIATGVWEGTAVDTANGGTGLTGYTAGDLLYYSTGTSLAKLGIATDGQVLQLVSGVPAWGDIDGGTF